jgi:early secretory antigenic target protein ESAT-6
MPQGDMNINFGALDTAASDVSGAASGIQGRLDQLDSELAPLRADWTGSASEAYQSAKAQWSAAMLDIHALLAQVPGMVNQSNADYQSAESTNTGRW